jgi:hypothetical protein
MTSSRSTDRSARSSKRAELQRALVVNALIHPVNVLVPAGVVVAGVLIGAAWLAIVAVVCWLVLSGVTFFDEREAQRVGERLREAGEPPPPRARADPATLAPAIRRRVRAATAACAGIRSAIAASHAPLADLEQEIEALLAAIHADAIRAQRIHAFLAQEPAAEPAALTRLSERLDALLAEMDRVVATLQTVQAEILAADGIELEQRGLVTQVSELRAKVRIMSTGLEETYAGVKLDTEGS